MKCRQPFQTTVQGWIDRGLGQGDLAQFQPLYLVRDKASQSDSRNIYSRVTQRFHDYVGELPYECHILASYRSDIHDIREEFAALPWDETQQIARALGIPHPRWSKSGVPKLLTTGLLVSFRTALGIQHVAISFTSEKALSSSAALEEKSKIRILEHYWKARAIQHLVVTQNNLPRRRAQNLGMFWLGVVNPIGDATPVSVESFVQRLTEKWSPRIPRNELISTASDSLGITSELGESLLGRAVWSRKISLDLDSDIDYRLPLPLQT